ncbi:carbonic anhydrase [Dyella sp. Tek66A03]|uniref:carbonic anhydrase n=1 Tax=Dyella sp. Tek66A03 TaxID=3458298 RepID=UPI00403E78D5
MRKAWFHVLGWATLVLSSASVSAADQPTPPAHAHHWSYAGANGPGHWGSLDDADVACGKGEQQSPIDLDSRTAKTGKSGKFHINYQPGAVTLLNNGHTVEAEVGDAADTVTFEGASYRLAQFHFHAPSEHSIDGKHFPLEIHFVNKDAEGHITVVGVLVRAGAENKNLAAVFNALPAHETPAGEHADKPAQVDLAAVLPSEHKAFVYNGSLTTPPCTEGVHWIVLAQPVEMSRAQIGNFAKIFHDNHRPLQKINGRQIDSETY